MIELLIDGTRVSAQPGASVLDAALAAGIYIPHLCSHPALPAQGACRLCVCEIDGVKKLACSTEVSAGMHVATTGEDLMKLRRMSMELMLAGHPEDCTSCRSYLKCELQAMMQYLSVTHSRMHTIHRKNTQLNNENPLIIRDMQRCIQCGRCVRVCREVRGVNILDYCKHGGEVYVGTRNDLPLADAGCRFCGACVEICPTGALLDREDVFAADVPRDQALVPCENACPAHIEVPRFVRAVAQGERSEAEAIIREKVTFPQTLGCVCDHKCEASCRRGHLNTPVSICRLKRYAVTDSVDQTWKQRRTVKPSTGRRVAVIGAGPAGLTSAYYLRKQGHQVDVFEAREKAGGQLQFGLPGYRLPKDIVQREVQDILDVGITLHCGTPVQDPKRLAAEYDAVVVAIGVSNGVVLPLPGRESAGVMTALAVMAAVNRGEELPVGKRCFVIGGGSVGFDTARTLRRLGAERVMLACIESRSEMRAAPDEIREAEEEGIEVYPSRNFLELTSAAGHVSGVRTNSVERFWFDSQGRLELCTEKDSERLFEADMVVFAVGQHAGAFSAGEDFERGRANTILLEQEGSRRVRGCENIFAVGDAVTGIQFVITAIAGGRETASEVDRFLGGDGIIDEILTQRRPLPLNIGKQEGFAFLPRQDEAVRPAQERKNDFAVVSAPLSHDSARCEASRCLQCDLRLCIEKAKMWTGFSAR